MPTTTTEKKTATIAPFGIEADPPVGGDLMIQTIRGLRLRGAMRGAKPVVNNKGSRDNTPVIPVSRATVLGQLPHAPGMELHVNPSSGTAKAVDPLFEDEKLCERIRRSMRQAGFEGMPEKMEGVEPRTEKLDRHQIKTLVREMVRLVDSDHARVVRGSLPSMGDVDAMPGDYLLNHGNEEFNFQPKFEKDYDSWRDRLNRLGGD